jgi:hypothetical protein
MDIYITLLLVFISLAIGFLLNALLSSMRKKPPAPEGGEKGNSGILPDEQVRIWRDPDSQQLLVETEGQVFLSAGGLNDGQRSRLAELAGDLKDWVRGPGRPAGRQPVPSPSAPAATDLRNLAGSTRSTLPARPAGGEPGRPDLNPLKVFTSAFRSSGGSAREAAPGSIVAQIDELLQASLEFTPLAGRGIRLSESPGGGMIVAVGLRSYESIEAVPDPEVRAAIRKAVVDWEARLSK